MSRVELKLESPLMTGGKRIKDNVLQSLDYIPGSVMRAAFAKYILMHCPLYTPEKCDDAGRYNYVYIRDSIKCKGCPFYDSCSNFSSIKFSFFYPKDFQIIPFTARKCKVSNNHGFIDTLILPENLKCKKCNDENKDSVSNGRIGRMESARGFRMGRQSVKLDREVFTRTSVDPYTLTAKDGSLYSIYAIKQGITFVGDIDGFEMLNLKIGDEIYAGSYNTVGFGKLTVQNVCIPNQYRNLHDDIIRFNERIRNAGYSPDKTYIPMLLISDAKLGIEDYDFDKPLSNDEYKSIWKKLLFSDVKPELNVEKVFSEQDIYKGYDTSKPWGKWEKAPQVLVLKGTTILASTEKPVEEIIDVLNMLEHEGIGRERENGFGKVEICDELHVKGEI